tara:strand:+ start:134 stop:544 length:411 start_codon:yes stop_codon:yes gene_type:complete
MVGRTEQAIWNGDRWYGGAVSETIATGVTSARRYMHPEESRAYYFTTTGSGIAYAYVPVSVVGFALGGPYFTIWNDAASSVSIRVSDSTGIVSTLAAGRSVQVYLHDLDPGEGISGWTALDDGTSGVLSGPRAHLA